MIARKLFLITILLTCGCEMARQRKPVVHRDPAFPMTLSTGELVTALNQQCRNLQSWKCSKTKLHVRLPNGLRQRLSGATACEGPGKFRLTASNLIAKTDFGANDERCWFYSDPGDSSIVTWKHEDTELLQHLPSGIPYLDSEWLMTVLCMKPLEANDYKISADPLGSPELWLTAIEDTPSGRPIRRVIKVDTINGVVREHALFDSEANPLVRAILSDYQSRQGNQIPGNVKLLFPQMDFEMTLVFDDIQVNPSLPNRLWQMPHHSTQVVDIGQALREKLVASGQAPKQQSFDDLESPFYVPPEADSFQPSQKRYTTSQPKTPEYENVRSAFVKAQAEPSNIYEKMSAVEELEEPDWATPASHSEPNDSPRRGLLNWWKR